MSSAFFGGFNASACILPCVRTGSIGVKPFGLVEGKRACGAGNGKRIVFSNDGLIYYTQDHYESFDEIEVIWSDGGTDSYVFEDRAYENAGEWFSDEDLDAIVSWLFGA